MVETQLIELATAVQSVQAQLMASEVAQSTLQAQVERLGRTSGERKIGVDTRNLGRPPQFNGTDSAWRDWSVVFRSYAALVHPALKDEMQRVERLSTAETNAGLIEAEQVQASAELYLLLLHSTSGPALDRVVSAGSAEGLRAWQLLVEIYDPHIRSRTAGQLLSLLQFDFSGDMLAKLEAHERDLALYEQASMEKISDGLRVGIVLNRVTDTELATHLLLNSERFQTWALFRREIVDVSRGRAAAAGAYQMRRGVNDSNTAPMEIDALQQHSECHTCGRFGHLAKDCWQNKSKSKGKDPKGKGGKKGKGKGKGKTNKDVCSKCGQRGHWAKNCPNPAKAIHGLGGPSGANNSWWQWYDGQEWKAPSEQSTAENHQPMAEPEAAMGGLWPGEFDGWGGECAEL